MDGGAGAVVNVVFSKYLRLTVLEDDPKQVWFKSVYELII